MIGFDLVSFNSLDTLDTSGSMDMAGMDMPHGDMHFMHMLNLAGYSSIIQQLPPSSVPDATCPGGANLASAVTNSTSEATGLSMLSFLLLISVLWRDPTFSLLDIATRTRRKSQVIALAEPPPPRLA